MVRPFFFSAAFGLALWCVACGPTIDVGSNNSSSKSDAGGVADPAVGAGTATVSGTVGGRSLDVKGVFGEADNSGQIHELWVSIGNRADACTLLNQGAEDTANTFSLKLDLTSDPPDGAAPVTLGPGTYTVGAVGPTVYARLWDTDATCEDGGGYATSGTITIADASATSLSGSFDLTFSNGSLKGDFAAAICVDTGASHTVKCAP